MTVVNETRRALARDATSATAAEREIPGAARELRKASGWKLSSRSITTSPNIFARVLPLPVRNNNLSAVTNAVPATSARRA